MGISVCRSAGLGVVLTLVPVFLAAATPDLRLVTAAAEQDHAAVKALLRQGADVNTARADGATALLRFADGTVYLGPLRVGAVAPLF